MAIASLVTSIPGVCCFPLGIIAIIFGVLALNEIKDPSKAKTGKPMAISGIAMGIMGLLFAISAMIVSPPSSEQTTDSPEPVRPSPTTVASTSETSTTAPKKPTALKMGEPFKIGYTSYAVWRAWWSNQLSDNQFLNQPPDASYLFIDLTIRNDDNKARTIPPFKLIDENGAEYETSSRAFAIDGGIGPLTSLNPGVKKQGVIVFDVPRERKYKLKVSGGFWSGEHALVEIDVQ
jgi:hypothetical protein